MTTYAKDSAGRVAVLSSSEQVSSGECGLLSSASQSIKGGGSIYTPCAAEMPGIWQMLNSFNLPRLGESAVRAFFSAVKAGNPWIVETYNRTMPGDFRLAILSVDRTASNSFHRVLLDPVSPAFPAGTADIYAGNETDPDVLCLLSLQNLIDIVAEKTTLDVWAEIRGDDGAPVDVTSVTWTLTNQDGTVVNAREDVATTPAARFKIALTADDLVLTNEVFRFETLLLEITAQYTALDATTKEVSAIAKVVVYDTEAVT